VTGRASTPAVLHQHPGANVDGRQGRSRLFTHRNAPRSTMLIVVPSQIR